MTNEEAIHSRSSKMAPLLDERLRRLWAGAEALTAGPNGVQCVAGATGLSHHTVRAGCQELEAAAPPPLPPPKGMWGGARKKGVCARPTPPRIRAPGAGRKPLTQTNPLLLADLDALIEPETRGDPASPLRWCCKSTRQLATALQAKGYPISYQKVAELLRSQGYSLQRTRKTREGASHPDRDAQFRRISAQCTAFQTRNQPVISVDTKKKELIGDFANGGQEWQPQGAPEPVRTHDFLDKQLGRAIPYGVYDLGENNAWVSVGVDHDTPTFAVQAIRTWWERMGQATYPEARELLITADGGGSNGSRRRGWKWELQRWADETGLSITVCHFPPGTSKWKKIEHRLFCQISENWRGQALESREVIVNLIGNTTTRTGLRVQAELDLGSYPTQVKVSQEQFDTINITPADFHGEWNYTIASRPALIRQVIS